MTDTVIERRLLGLIGLGMRGRNVVVGVEQVRVAARKGALALAVVAPDASANSLKKIVPLLAALRIPELRGLGAAKLGAAEGREEERLSKLRVNDLAGEFGITAEEVMDLLRKMDVPVRSHLSPLADDAVGRVRVRWEREKRHRQENPSAAPARRRRAPAAEAAPVPAAAETASAG